MRYFRTACIILVLALCPQFTKPVVWVDQLTDYIADHPNYQLVNFLTTSGNNETIRRFIIEELLTKMMKNVPTVRTNIEEIREDSDHRRSLDPTDNLYIIDSTATLFMLFHDSIGNSSLQNLTTLIDAAAGISALHYRRKFLLILIGPGLNRHIEYILHYAQKKRILYFTLLEVLEEEPMLMKMWKRSTESSPIVHKLSNEDYKQMEWPEDVSNLFPEKITDLIHRKANIRKSFADPEAFEETVLQFLIRAFREECKSILKTTKTNSLLKEFHDYRDNLFRKNDNDALFATIPYVHLSDDHDVSLTTAINIRRYCAIVPKLKESKTSLNTRIFPAYLLSLSIILVYRVVARILNFRGPLWELFGISRTLFGISVTRLPTGNIERIVFMSLVTISAAYSGYIYGIMTDISLETEHEVLFQSYKDLDESGLTAEFPSWAYLYFLTIHDDVHTIDNIVAKGRMTFDCADQVCCTKSIVQSGNKIFCVSDIESNQAVEAIGNQYGGEVKIFEPCLYSTPLGIMISKKSPYREVIDKLITQMKSVGFLGPKFCSIELEHVPKELEKIQVPKPNYRLTKQLLTVLIGGLTLATITFLFEIIWYHRTKIYSSLFRKKCIKTVCKSRNLSTISSYCKNIKISRTRV